MEHIEYCNNLINIMASRTQKYEIKNVLTDCDLNINYHGMNGNLQECSVTLFCSQNDYFNIKDNAFKDEIYKLLIDCIPESDRLDVINFEIGILNDSIEFETNVETLKKDIFKLERLIKSNHSSKMVSFFTTLSIKYSSLISNWLDVSDNQLARNNIALDRDKVKLHALKILKIMKEYYGEIEEKQTKNRKDKIDNRFDVFISHANKDKIDYVEDLKDEIKNLGVNVFYDKEAIDWGDNWKQVILNGIEKSRFAIIVISNNFFGREWTNKELKMFLEKQNKNEQKIILPILYNVTPEEVFKMYPELEEIQFIKAIDFDFKDIAIKFSKELIKDLR